MNCPKCKVEMEKVSYQSVEVDRCTRCGGIWFDLLEHKRLKGLPGAEALDVGSPDRQAALDALEKVDCPVCQTRMTRLADVRQPHIWYESCPVCSGVFFDAGEFRDYKEETLFELIKTWL
ncbi:MAG: zf-TFIIB domain-containing protein [Thermoflexales bacterium]|nr:zf-TFIIB domain-containing protein [Thermoflexales bacterium]